ncbi:MAG: uracil-DNA glycosylase family protein, partial [Dermatophilaceae bacterium]
NQPTAEERASCAAWLRRDLELAAPRLRAVLCLGGLAWDAALGAARDRGGEVPTPRPRFGHAAEVAVRMTAARSREEARVIRVVGSYHVSPHNTFTGRLTSAMLDDVLLSLRA